MWEKNLWFRIVYNKVNTPENIDKIRNGEDAQNFADLLRKEFAELINQMDWMRDETESPDQKRLCSIAISKLEEACMFCVKASTYNF